ncbi:MAG: AmmeMemoRadiSam system radical SAM enzyme [Campylobacterales bacterium]
MNYFEIEGDRVICLLCAHKCKLKEGIRGICGVNRNEKGRLICDVYGYPSALNLDRVEKKPLYHFLPNTTTLSLGTVGCNFRCSFCQNYEISQDFEPKKGEYISPTDMVRIAKAKGARSISYTYNEPSIFFPYAKDIAQEAENNKLKNIMVTNGFFSLEYRDEIFSHIDAMNIDIKSFNKEYYKKSLKGELDVILQNAIKAKEVGVWVEITTLIVGGINDSDEEIANIARFIKENLGEDTPWHLSAFFPNYKELDRDATTFERLLEAKFIGNEAGLEYVYLGNVMFDNKTECPRCKVTVINRVGNEVLNKLEEGRCYNCDYKIAGIWS